MSSAEPPQKNNDQSGLIFSYIAIALGVIFSFVGIWIVAINFPGRGKSIIFFWISLAVLIVGILLLIVGVVYLTSITSQPPQSFDRSDYSTVFPLGLVDANLVNRETIDNNCQTGIPPGLTCQEGSVHGFISINKEDSIANMPENYNLDRNKPVIGYTGEYIADDWNKFITEENGATTKKALFPDGVGVGEFWSGSNQDGTTSEKISDGIDQGTCGNWDHIDIEFSRGQVGNLGSGKWLSSSARNCKPETKKLLICACKNSG